MQVVPILSALIDVDGLRILVLLLKQRCFLDAALADCKHVDKWACEGEAMVEPKPRNEPSR